MTPLPAHDELAEALLTAQHVIAEPVALDPADLLSPTLAHVWRTADTLERPVDLAALAMALRASGKPGPTGGWPRLLSTLVTESPAVADPAPVVERVRALAHQRRLAAELAAMAAEARTEQPAGWADTVVTRVQAMAPRPVARVGVVTGAALAEPVPAVPWVCEWLQLAPGRPTMLSGYGGAGKTMLACSLALDIAAARRRSWDALDLQRTGPVRHLNWEMHEDSIRARYQRLALGRKIDLAATELGLCNRREMQGLTLTSPTVVRDLSLLLDGVTLALFDSFRAAIPGVDENSSEVRRYLDVLLEVTERTGCTMLVIHHLGKTSPDPRGQRDPVQMLRGSSGINDALDTSWAVIAGEHALRVTQGKVSRGKKSDDLNVRIEDTPEGGLIVTNLESEQLVALAAADNPDRKCEASILTALREHGPQSQTTIESGSKLGVEGSRGVRRRCLAQLVADGCIEVTGAGPARRFGVV
jgi:hypothetical protein